MNAGGLEVEWEAVIQWGNTELVLGVVEGRTADAALKEAQERAGRVCVAIRPRGSRLDYDARENIVKCRDGFRQMVRAERRSRVGPKR